MRKLPKKIDKKRKEVIMEKVKAFHKKIKSNSLKNEKTNSSPKNNHSKNNSKHNDFKALFSDEISDLLSAENQMVVALPIIIHALKNEKLKEALKTHLKETKNQVIRLKKVFSIIGEKPVSKTCKGMEGILKEGSELLNEQMDAELRDAFIIGIAQRVEHYEMAGYGTARSHAIQLGLEQVSDLLKETLDEEANADKTLTKIAEGTIFTTGVNKIAYKVEEKEEVAMAA